MKGEVPALAGLLALGACGPVPSTLAERDFVRDPRGNFHHAAADEPLVETCPGEWAVQRRGHQRPYGKWLAPDLCITDHPRERAPGFLGVLEAIHTPSHRSSAGFWAGQGMAAPSWGLGR
jgi:hypothetical protein